MRPALHSQRNLCAQVRIGSTNSPFGVSGLCQIHIQGRGRALHLEIIIVVGGSFNLEPRPQSHTGYSKESRLPLKNAANAPSVESSTLLAIGNTEAPLRVVLCFFRKNSLPCLPCMPGPARHRTTPQAPGNSLTARHLHGTARHRTAHEHRYRTWYRSLGCTRHEPRCRNRHRTRYRTNIVSTSYATHGAPPSGSLGSSRPYWGFASQRRPSLGPEVKRVA